MSTTISKRLFADSGKSLLEDSFLTSWVCFVGVYRPYRFHLWLKRQMWSQVLDWVLSRLLSGPSIGSFHVQISRFDGRVGLSLSSAGTTIHKPFLNKGTLLFAKHGQIQRPPVGVCASIFSLNLKQTKITEFCVFSLLGFNPAWKPLPSCLGGEWQWHQFDQTWLLLSGSFWRRQRGRGYISLSALWQKINSTAWHAKGCSDLYRLPWGLRKVRCGCFQFWCGWRAPSQNHRSWVSEEWQCGVTGRGGNVNCLYAGNQISLHCLESYFAHLTFAVAFSVAGAPVLVLEMDLQGLTWFMASRLHHIPKLSD